MAVVSAPYGLIGPTDCDPLDFVPMASSGGYPSDTRRDVLIASSMPRVTRGLRFRIRRGNAARRQSCVCQGSACPPCNLVGSVSRLALVGESLPRVLPSGIQQLRMRVKRPLPFAALHGGQMPPMPRGGLAIGLIPPPCLLSSLPVWACPFDGINIHPLECDTRYKVLLHNSYIYVGHTAQCAMCSICVYVRI